MMKQIFCFWIGLLGVLTAFAQSKVVSASVDKPSILIGEKIQLTLQATLPKSTGTWFEWDTIPHFEVLEKSKIDTVTAIDGLKLTQTVTLTSWDSGSWVIPAFTLSRFQTLPIPVAVGHVPMDYNQPYHDIKDIIAVQKARSSNWYWYLVGIVVLLVLFMLFFPPKKKSEGKPAENVDVFKASIKRLDALRADDEPKVFYTELINVFRFYLQHKKGLQSFSKTTDDLSVQIKQQLALPNEAYTQLVQVLRLSDSVKFARFVPYAEENKASLDTIRKTIVMIEGGKA